MQWPLFLPHGQFDFVHTTSGLHFSFDRTVLHGMRSIAGRMATWTGVSAQDGTHRDQFVVVAKSMRRVDVVGFAVGFAECAFQVFAELFATPASFDNQGREIERR